MTPPTPTPPKSAEERAGQAIINRCSVGHDVRHWLCAECLAAALTSEREAGREEGRQEKTEHRCPGAACPFLGPEEVERTRAEVRAGHNITGFVRYDNVEAASHSLDAYELRFLLVERAQAAETRVRELEAAQVASPSPDEAQTAGRRQGKTDAMLDLAEMLEDRIPDVGGKKMRAWVAELVRDLRAAAAKREVAP